MRVEIRTICIATILMGLLATNLYGWERNYGGKSWDNGVDVVGAPDGGYLILGTTLSRGAGSYDIYLVRTDARGDTLWTRTCGGHKGEEAGSVRRTSDGGYLIVGTTDSYGAGGNDVYLIRTDARGDTLWTRTYGGPKGDYGHSAEEVPGGEYLIVGTTDSYGAGSYDLYLVRTDASGKTVWIRTYGGSKDDEARSVRRTSDGGYIIVGSTLSYGAGGNDVYAIRTDAHGDTLWTRTYGTAGVEYARAVQITPEGGYIIAGTTAAQGAGLYDVYLICTDARGDTLWTRTYGTKDREYGHSVQVMPDGGFVVVGTTHTTPRADQVYVIRTDERGNPRWIRSYGGQRGERGHAVQVTPDGGFVVVGSSEFSAAGGSDVYLIRLGADGDLLDR